MNAHPGNERETILEQLERELTLLARHQLASAQHDPGLALDRSGYQILGRLEAGPVTLAQLAEAFRLDVSTINRQVAALRRKGFVERRPDPEGGLAQQLAATRSGLTQLRRDRRTKRGHVDKVVGDWKDKDVSQLLASLRQFNEAIEELEGRPWPRS